MNLQLYMVDSINYLVDFHHKKSYRASTEAGAGKFDMAVYDPLFLAESSSETGSGRLLKEKDGSGIKEDKVVSPFVFMDVACRLILLLNLMESLRMTWSVMRSWMLRYFLGTDY
jgi:carbon catabolite-derepressing protein kinase